VELFLKEPLTEQIAEIHLQRAWYVAVGSATVMLLGAVFRVSLSPLLVGVSIIGLGHGMLRRSWVAGGALLFYLVGMILQLAWADRQPLFVLPALAVGYFLTQGCRALWWWYDTEEIPPPSPAA
jgi:hypothetical protein